jgi:hypothetical protein
MLTSWDEPNAAGAARGRTRQCVGNPRLIWLSLGSGQRVVTTLRRV